MDQDLSVAGLSSEERREHIKANVLRYMATSLDRLDGRIVLYHESDPVPYDEQGQWTFDEQTTVQ